MTRFASPVTKGDGGRRMASFEHNGRVIRYTDEGGDGSPLVFMHGLGASSAQSVATLGALDGYRLIAWDAPSHGESGAAPELHTFDAMGGAVLALLDHLGLDRVTLGGISMGAGIAINAALRSTERVRALAVVRPAWLDAPSPEHLEVVARVGRDMIECGTDAARERLDADPWFVELQASNPACAASLVWVLEREWTPEGARVLIDMVASAPFESRDDLVRLTVPAIVIASDADPLHPISVAKATAAALPAAEFLLAPRRYSEPAAHRDAVRMAAGGLGE